MDWDAWKTRWESIWAIDEARFVILGAGLVALITIAVYVALKARQLLWEGVPLSADHLNDFRDMHSQGHLAPEEYERIRQTLGEEVRRKLRDESQR